MFSENQPIFLCLEKKIPLMISLTGSTNALDKIHTQTHKQLAENPTSFWPSLLYLSARSHLQQLSVAWGSFVSLMTLNIKRVGMGFWVDTRCCEITLGSGWMFMLSDWDSTSDIINGPSVDQWRVKYVWYPMRTFFLSFPSPFFINYLSPSHLIAQSPYILVFTHTNIKNK